MLVVIAAFSLAWWAIFVQPVSVTSENAVVHVDLRRLGEYYANLVRLRLVDGTNDAVVVELEAIDGSTPAFGVTLRPGTNPSNLGLDDVRLVGPVRDTNFILRRGGRYRLEMWTLMDFGVVSHRRVAFDLR